MLVKEDRHDEDVRILLARLPASIPRRGVIHVGAHVGEEVSAYQDSGFQEIILIEANPRHCLEMTGRFQANPAVHVFNCAISDRTGISRLYLHTNRRGETESASLLEMKELSRIVPTLTTEGFIEVQTYSMDEFVEVHGIEPAHVNLLNLDIQGAEFLALTGATRLLSYCSAVITEVNVRQLYAEAALEDQVVDCMTRAGFRRDQAVYHSLYDETSIFLAWGETLFLKMAQ